MRSDPNSLTYSSAKPDVAALCYNYERCSPYSGVWNRLSDNDATRYTIWEGQSSDGRKWDKNQAEGREAEPWDGCSDARIPMADSIINRIVAINTEALSRSMLRLEGTEPDDAGRAAQARRALDWLKVNKLLSEMRNESELLAQYGATYGVGLMMVDWEREISFKLYELTVADLEAIAQQQGASVLALIGDTDLEEQGIEMLKNLHELYVNSRKPSNYDWSPRPLSNKRARMMLKELRESGRCRVPMPYVCRNQPCLRALKLWEDAFIPPETTGVQSARVVFVRDWLTEAELEQAALVEGWDEEWVDKAKQFKGQYSNWRWSGSTSLRGQPELEYLRDSDAELIEVLYAYVRQVDEDGISGIYRTVFHPQIKDSYGLHGLLPHWHGKLPFVEWRFEQNARQLLMSRGVPYITATWQRAVKVLVDAVTDRTQYSVLPSIVVPHANWKFGPAYQIINTRPEQKPSFVEAPPGGGMQEAFAIIGHIQKQADDYFGRRRADEPPEESIAIMQRLVRSFLVAGSEILQQMLQLMLQYLPPEEIERITGQQSQITRDPEDVSNLFDYMLAFDVQELNPEFMSQKLEALQAKIAPMDRAGILDWAKITKLQVAALDPSWASAITTDKAGAQQQRFQQVQNDFISMYQGNPPRLIQDDPAAQMELEFGQQILNSNPLYMAALQQPKTPEQQLFQKNVEEWFKNRKFNVDQMVVNPQIGHLGVNPSAQAN